MSAGDRFIDAYTRAVAAYVELQRTPRWRRRRRRGLEWKVQTLCELAERRRDELAEAGGGYVGEPRPLREVLDDAWKGGE